MANRKDTPELVRTSVLVREATDKALRELAEEAHRPLSWEIRLALEAHVDRGRTRRADDEPDSAEQEQVA